MMRRSCFILIILYFCVLDNVRGQQQTPFVGQGIPPEGGTTVFVTVALDRLIDVNDQNYRFEAIFFMLLTWKDPRAKLSMLESTAAAANGSASCQLPCTSMFKFQPGRQCCDEMWLPQLEFINVRGFNQDRVVRYGITFGPGNSSAVAWWAQCSGEFFTNLIFKAFPFDSQKLLIHVAYASDTPDRPVDFAQGGVSLSTYMPSWGDDISGWSIKNMTMIFYNVTDEIITDRITASNILDPFPIAPKDPNSPKFVSDLWIQGFTIILEIDRISLYFVLTIIIPIALNVWLALLVFSVSPKHLDTRLGVVVTLFLSLTALMMVVAGELPQSSTIVPTQQLCLVSYFVLGFVGLESILTYKLVTMVKQQNIKHRTRRAQKQFTQRWTTIQRSMQEGNRKSNLNEKSSWRAGTWLRRRPASRQPTLSPIPSERETSFSLHESDITLEDGRERINAGAGDAAISNRVIGVTAVSTGQTSGNLALPHGGEHHHQNKTISQHSTIGFVPLEGHNGDSDETQSLGNNSGAGSFQSSDTEPTAGNIGQLGQGGRANSTANSQRWLGRQTNRWKEIWRELRNSPDYSLYMALKVDRFMFWFVLVAYNLTLIILMAVCATYQDVTTFT